MAKTAEELIKDYESLSADRASWLNVWQEINDYVLPERSPFIGADMPGEQRGRGLIFSSLPTKLVYSLSANLNALLTNPSSRWFELETDNQALNRDDENRGWLQETADIIARVLENSNFYTEINKMYIDLVAYGTGCMFIEVSNDPEKHLYFSTRHLKEIYIKENKEEYIDTVYRYFEMTARNALSQFPKGLSDRVKELAGKKPEDKINFLHCVYPRSERDNRKSDILNKKYASVWIEYEDKNIVKEKGYDTFPYLVPRWTKESGEKYGRSPTMTAMGDIRTLNDMMKTLLKVSQRAADPIWMLPDEGISDVTMKPGEIMYVDALSNIEPKVLYSGQQIPITHNMLTEIKDSISEIYYVSQLQLITKDRMTAEEVRARQAEHSRVLGPTFGVFQHEMLSPFIDRVLDILQGVIIQTVGESKLLLPEPPQAIQGKPLKLKFVSPLAKAQRMHELQSIVFTLRNAIDWSTNTQKPEILDNINFDAAIKTTAEIDGTPVDVLNNDKAVVAIREQRQALIKQAQDQQAQVDNAKAAKDTSRAAKTFAEAKEV